MHHPNARSLSLGWLPGSPATGLCRWGGYRGPRRQVFVAGVVTGVPGDRSLSLGWLPGSPATGLCRWGGYRGPRRQVFVAGVVTGVPGDRSLSLGWSGAWVGNHVSQFTTIFCRRYNRTSDQTSPPTAPTVGFISLGCPKNLVDSEVMMGLLDRAGARLTAHPEDAEILVVNTCSFIDTAKQESVDTILEMARHKTSGSAQAHRRRLPRRALPRRNPEEHPRSRRRRRHRRAGIHPRSRRPRAPRPPRLSPFNILTGTAATPKPPRPGIPRRHAQAITSRQPLPDPKATTASSKGRFRRDDWQGATQGRFDWQGAAHLSLRRNHPALLSTPRQILGLHQNRRGLRPPLHLLRHPQPARQIPLAPLRIRRRRSPAARRPRRPARSPSSARTPPATAKTSASRTASPRCSTRSPASPACAGCASSTPIPTASPAAARHHRAHDNICKYLDVPLQHARPPSSSA
jgi:hypothetical protein